MTCHDCTASAERPHHGFRAECKGCAARAVARGPNYRESKLSGRQSWKYRAELDQMGVTHEQVREAAQADALNRSQAPQWPARRDSNPRPAA